MGVRCEPAVAGSGERECVHRARARLVVGELDLGRAGADAEAIRAAGGEVAFEAELARAYGTVASDPEEAGRIVEAAARAFATEEIVQLAAAFLLCRAGRVEEALQANRRALDKRRNYALAWYSRAQLSLHLWRQDRKPEKLEEIRGFQEKVARLAPDWWVGWEGLARVLQELRQHDGAARAATRAIALDPRADVAYYLLLHALMGCDGPEDLDRILTHAVERVPTKILAVHTRGYSRFKRRQFAPALEDFRKARALAEASGEPTAKIDIFIRKCEEALQ